MDFEFYPVDKNRWQDFERLFESKGGPHYCWCMVWRKVGSRIPKSTKPEKKNAIKKYVEDQIPIGLLGYCNEEPVAWCSVAPRETYRNLGGDDSRQGVWSLVCFFIKKEYRNQQLTGKLIEEATIYARKNGAKYIEGYPVAPSSPSYGFMGYKPTFEKAGFKFVKKAGTRRNVMIKAIK